MLLFLYFTSLFFRSAPVNILEAGDALQTQKRYIFDKEI